MQRLSKTGSVTVEGCTKTTCWVMSLRLSLNVEGGRNI